MRKFIFWIQLLAFYTALAVLFTLPLVIHFQNYILSSDFDSTQYIWNEWWMKESLTNLVANPFYTQIIYYPYRIGLIYNAFIPFHAFISVPLQIIFGLIPAHNFLILASLIVSAYGSYLLCYEITRKKNGSLLGSILFAFSPFVTEKIQMHINLSDIYPIPWFVFYLIRSLKQPRLINIMLASIFLLIIFLTDYYYLFYTLLFTLLFFIYFHQKILFHTLLRIFLLFSILILPYIVFFITDLKQNQYFEIYYEAALHSPDVLRYIIPWHNPYFQSLTNTILVSIGKTIEGENYYLGLLPICILFYIVYKRKLNNRFVTFFLLIFVVFFLLSLGPVLKIAGATTNILLPFAVLLEIPIIRELRVSGRFAIFCYLSLAVISSYGITEMLKGFQSKFKLVVLFISTFILLFEFYPGLRNLEYFPLPSVYNLIRNDSDHFAVLEIPVPFWSDPYRIMYYQTVHEKPIIGGMLSRVPKAVEDYYWQDFFLANIISLHRPEIDYFDLYHEKLTEEIVKSSLSTYHIKYILLHANNDNEVISDRMKQLKKVLDRMSFLKLINNADSIFVYTYNNYSQ